MQCASSIWNDSCILTLHCMWACEHHLGWACLQVRDLRILDPAMSTSYPSAILCRDKALLVNLEHIKCIITSQYVLVLNAEQVGPPAGCIKDECQHALILIVLQGSKAGSAPLAGALGAHCRTLACWSMPPKQMAWPEMPHSDIMKEGVMWRWAMLLQPPGRGAAPCGGSAEKAVP